MNTYSLVAAPPDTIDTFTEVALLVAVLVTAFWRATGFRNDYTLGKPANTDY